MKPKSNNVLIVAVIIISISLICNLHNSEAQSQKYNGSIGVVTIGFDHGFKEQYNASLYMKSKNMVGTMFVVTNRNVNPNFLSWTGINTMNASGWESTSHSRTHVKETDLSLPQLNSEIIGSKTDLINDGIKVCGFTPPFAFAYNGTIFSIIQHNYKYTMMEATDQNTVTSLNTTVLYGQPIAIKIVKTMAVGDVGNTATTGFGQIKSFDDAKKQIDYAVANHSYLMIHFHDFTNSTVPLSKYQLPTSWTLFDKIINYLASQRDAGNLLVEPTSSALGMTCQ